MSLEGNKVALALALSAAVTACGGGGDATGTSAFCTTAACRAANAPSPSPTPATPSTPPPPTTPSTPTTPGSTSLLEGFFTGTISNGYEFGVVMLDGGELWGIYIRGSVIYGAFHGTTVTNGSSFTSTGASVDLQTGTRTPSTANGTYSAKSSIAGTIQSNGAAFTGTYDSSYETPASLSSIQGAWSGQVISRAGLQAGSVTFSPTGTFSGTVTTCHYTGSATPRPGGKNVFNISVSFAASGCLFNSATLSGIVVIRNGQLITLALLPDGSDGFMALATH